MARAEYRSWRQGDAYASPVPNGGKKLGTDDLLRQLLEGSSPLQALDEDGLTGCLSGYLNGLAPREVQQAPATRLQDEFKLQEVLGVGGFGVVRLARHRVSGALYAVKSIMKSRIRRIGEERTFELLERERKTLKKLATSAGAAGAAGAQGGGTCAWLICSAHDGTWLRLVMPAYLGGDWPPFTPEQRAAQRRERIQGVHSRFGG